MIQRDYVFFICTKAPEKQIIYKMVKKDTPTSNPTYLNKKQSRQEKVKKKKKNQFLDLETLIYT